MIERVVSSAPLRFLIVSLLIALTSACQPAGLDDPKTVSSRSLRDLPADQLAYKFSHDVVEPSYATSPEEPKVPTVQVDFDASRPQDALLRTVKSPDGKRVLALYATPETPEGEFRIDLYTTEGRFLRNLIPQDLSCAFLPSVAWSPNGERIAFIGLKRVLPQPTPLPFQQEGTVLIQPSPNAVPTPTVPAASSGLPVFRTEQIYVCDRDGMGLRPVTTKEGFIYFHFEWAPNSELLAVLSCNEAEWQSQAQKNLPPAGRPRLVDLQGKERLLDDNLTQVLPAWSPDSSKVATAYGTEVAVYDAYMTSATAARIPLHDPLLSSSADYDKKLIQLNKNAASPEPTIQPGSTPLSYNPIVRLEWSAPELLYVQTGFVRIYANETVNNYMRWHHVKLSPQKRTVT
jgi:Tol biopolymer transport system component